MKTLQNSTRNWKTTIIGVLIILSWICNSILAYLQAGVMPSLEAAVAAWTVGTGFILAKDGDKTGAMKMLLLMPACLLLISCGTNAAGEKTFLLLPEKGWMNVLKGTGQEVAKTVPGVALKNYREELGGGKQVVRVQP